MKLTQVFIDFEAVSRPFSQMAKIPFDFPYAYTIGLYVNKKFKTCTWIFDFRKENINNINDILKNKLIADIRFLLQDPQFQVSPETVEFIGWSPKLEKKILSSTMVGYKVVALNFNFNISLSRLTPEITSNYFSYVKTLIPQTMSRNFIQKRAMNNDGAIAAYVGYLLYSRSANRTGQFITKFDSKIIIKELKKYSKEDVTRMHFLNSKPQLFHRRKNLALTLIQKKNKIAKELKTKEKLLVSLQPFADDVTVKDLKKILNKNVHLLKQEKEKNETNFKNFSNI